MEICKEKYKWRENEEEDVSRYWMILEERKDAVYLKAKHYFAFCGELEEAIYLS